MSYFISSAIWVLLLFTLLDVVNSEQVRLWNDGPIVKGGRITFMAAVSQDGEIDTGSFKYSWQDNAIPTHRKDFESKSGINSWSVEYNASVYPQGPYIVQVEVYKYYFSIVPYLVASNRDTFYINETLNGAIELIQDNRTRENVYVSNGAPVIHNVSLKLTDANYIKNAPTILTYWFIDCTYYGFRSGLLFPFNYTEADTEHLVEALVVADFTPLPPPPTTTTTPTTVKPNVTTTAAPKPNTTTTTAAPTTKPTTTALPTKKITKREVENNSNVTQHITIKNANGTLQQYNGSFPYVCNGTNVVQDETKIYGHFSKRIKVRQPVTKVNVTGNNWIQHGDLLTLTVKCQGSKTLKYCAQYYKGVHNITGNETCGTYSTIEVCEFMIQRFLMGAQKHTIVIIIENEVSRKVIPVTVTVYEENKQAQLSVIVVPVAFSLVAVVLIVFGVAYYLQNRTRFVVEVADFDFGQNYSDMEYKTFKERLRDSIANALFSKGPTPGSSEVPVWPPGRKYGSMTS